VTERIRLGSEITDTKQPGASTTATRYWVLSDTETFWEVAVATEEMAMILMSANLWKAAPAADSRGVPRFEQGFVGDCGGQKKEIQLQRETCFLLTETFDV